ncbi:nuclear transport factor 2 family protein [Candidatus Sumerlaeota bacterium]|nr:nuclear transport factor 2 family protein [Candidatus Sumerlaeota bacterium]MBI3736262.1 nuclear transport factor 2 family protein [Candidatus Sumerlaeota bacterium]
MKLAGIIFFAAAAFTTFNLRAQTPAAPEDPNHAELRLLREHVLDALNKEDIDTALHYAHPNIVLTTLNAEVCRGRDGVKAYFDRMMTGPNRIVKSFQIDIKPADLTVLYGGDTGVCWGDSLNRFVLTDGLKFDAHTRWTCTLVKEDGKWLIASFHTSVNIFDNPILNMAAHSLYWAVGGIPVALLAGLALGRFLKRKASTKIESGSPS